MASRLALQMIARPEQRIGMQIGNECIVMENTCFFRYCVGTGQQHGIVLPVDVWKNSEMQYAKCQEDKTCDSD